MDVSHALSERYTVRSFLPEPVDRDSVERILTAAARTPSWANTQPWEIYVAAGDPLERLRAASLERFRQGEPPHSDLPRPEGWPDELAERMYELGRKRFEALGIDRDDEEARRAVSEANYRFFGAPAVIYLCMDRQLSSWSVFDMGLLAQSIMLAATGEGLGTAIAYNLVTYPDLIREVLDIPASQAVIIGIALGHPDSGHISNSYRSSRRPLPDIATLTGFKSGS